MISPGRRDHDVFNIECCVKDIGACSTTAVSDSSQDTVRDTKSMMLEVDVRTWIKDNYTTLDTNRRIYPIGEMI